MDKSVPQSVPGYHSALIPTLKEGAEPIRDERGEERGTLLGFWRWAYSQTLDNTLRGVLAEYLVGLALGVVEGRPRIEWDAFDLTTDNGTRVEVKSTAFLQSWAQESPSALTFGIPETSDWDGATGSWGMGARRQSDVYVFCVFTTRDSDVADPLDTRQWDFYVASTHRLNEKLGSQKKIRLSELIRRVQPTKAVFSELADVVRGTASLQSRDGTSV